MVICIAEDRQSEETAVKLLLLSLSQYCPDVPVNLFFPPATTRFQQWLKSLPQVKLRTEAFTGVSGWNVKPYALLLLLEEGHDDVWWIDADVIVSRDFRQTIGHLTDSTLVISEEALYGQYRDDGYRAKAWGFEVGRSLPFNLNTAVVRVTTAHLPLIHRWKELLETEPYQKAQTLPYEKKPFHLFGDQDVLTALLASQEFAAIPLKILERGTGIIQYFGPSGFTLRERLVAAIDDLPPFVHCQREKPWRKSTTPPSWKEMRSYLNYIQVEVSPYCHLAAHYQNEMSEDLAWLRPRSRLSQLLRILGFGNPALTGIPIASLYSLSRLYKTIAKKDDRFDPVAAYQKFVSESEKTSLSNPVSATQV